MQHLPGFQGCFHVVVSDHVDFSGLAWSICSPGAWLLQKENRYILKTDLPAVYRKSYVMGSFNLWAKRAVNSRHISGCCSTI
jgi:hypothetical protein